MRDNNNNNNNNNNNDNNNPILKYEPCSVTRGLNSFAKVSIHVGLRSLRRLTWAETFRYL